MVDERVREYLTHDLAGDEEVIKLKLLKRRGFLIETCPDGTLTTNPFLKSIDNNDLSNFINMSKEDMVEKLFCKDSIIAHAENWKYKDKWGALFASNCAYGAKVPTWHLEPFMAKLVHSLSFCGMHTYYSCDGWHAERGRYKDRAFVGFLDRNSLIWFTILLRNDPDLACIKNEYKVEDHFITWYFTEDNRFDIYKALDRIADILYQKREQFRNQKKWVINFLKGQRKSTLSDEELKAVMETTYKACNVALEPYLPCRWDGVTREQANAFIKEIVAQEAKRKKKKA